MWVVGLYHLKEASFRREEPSSGFSCTVWFHIVASRQIHLIWNLINPNLLRLLLAGDYSYQISTISSSKKHYYLCELLLQKYLHSFFVKLYDSLFCCWKGSLPPPAAEALSRTQTFPHLCVCATAAAAAVVHLTRCRGQVWPLHCHCLAPFSSFLTGWATAGFKNPANRMKPIADWPGGAYCCLFVVCPPTGVVGK